MMHFLHVSMERICGVGGQTCKCHADGKDPLFVLLQEAALARIPEAKPPRKPLIG